MVIGPMDEEDASGINKDSKHKASVLYKKTLTRLSHTDSLTPFESIFIPPARKQPLLHDLTEGMKLNAFRINNSDHMANEALTKLQ